MLAEGSIAFGGHSVASTATTRRPTLARFPCSRCGDRYAGPQQTAYPAFVNVGMTSTEKLRLCPDCFLDVISSHWLDLVGGTAERFTTSCFSCGAPEGDVMVFVPYYERGQERQDLFGRLCGVCQPEAQMHVFGLAQAQERPPEPKQALEPIRWKEGRKQALSMG